ECDAGETARIHWRIVVEGAIRAFRVWMQVVLLLVRARHRGESILGSDGIRPPCFPRGKREEGARAHLLATPHSRG
ncbi:MAG: hypothetical protein ABIP55_15170, partial [Tepidisphaeraceae bacterium]